MELMVMIGLTICALYISIRFSGAVLAIIVSLAVIALSGGLFLTMIAVVFHISG
jgi:hypothetical protein